MPRSQDSEDYDIPETYLNLDEVAAPSPEASYSNLKGNVRGDRHVYRRSFERPAGIPYVDEDPEQQQEEQQEVRPQTQPAPAQPQQTSSHDFESNESQIRDITELAVLPPVGGQNRLEEDETENSTIWRSPRDKRTAQWATQLYTISYLILFSILGTLGRLGLQALTTYPGAPVTTGVLWANFAGSFVMGFLAEDRKLFVDEYGRRRSRMKQPERISPPESEHAGFDAEKEMETGVNIPPIRVSQVGVAISHPNMAYPSSNGGQRQSTAQHSSITRNESPHSASVISGPSGAPSAERRRHLAAKRAIPLFIGLTTGFCGSLTSFSSFQRDAFLALSNSPSASLNNTTLPVPRDGGYSFLAVLATLITTPGLCLFALVAGAHLALALHPWTPSISFSLTRHLLDRLCLVLAWGCWIGAVILAIFPPDRPDPSTPASNILPTAASWSVERWRGDALFAIVFAPLGCLARFYISFALNSRISSFPLGTFVVNIFGTLLEAGLYDLQRSSLSVLGTNLIGGGRTGCQVLQGMMDGFCGCLTTVSTWVAELGSLRRGHGWFYGLTSLLVGLASVVVIMGPVLWTIGWTAPVCGELH